MANFTVQTQYIYDPTGGLAFPLDVGGAVFDDQEPTGAGSGTFEVGDSVGDSSGRVPYVGTVNFPLSGGGTQTLPVLQDPGTGFFLILADGPQSAYSAPFSIPLASLSNGASITVCVLEGTAIATPQGEVTVEDLSVGAEVLTADGRAVPVRWVGVQSLSREQIAFGAQRLVRIAAGALGDGLPKRDLVVTGDHGMVLDGVIVNAAALVEARGIGFVTAETLPETVRVYHVETAAHEVILAEGAPNESFIDYVGRAAFTNYAEYLALYGTEREVPEMACPRITLPSQVPDRVRARLGLGPVMRKVA